MAEGKTLGTPGVKCESCEEANSSHYCCDCNQPLCARCTKQHGRIASTKLHKLITIQQYKSLASTTTNIDTSRAYCAKHNDQTIEKLCEDCLVVVCSECETDHRGHTLTRGCLDANLLHKASAQKIPGLLEIIQKLRGVEDGSPEKINLYKEAETIVKRWKNELLDLLNKDADRLLTELRGEIKKQEIMLTETSTKVQECIVKTDLQISKLSESRKISSTAKLLDIMSKCDKDIDDVKVYLENVKLSQEKLTMVDILPYKDEFDKTVNMMKTLFTKSDWGKGRQAASDVMGGGRLAIRKKQRVYDKLSKVREYGLSITSPRISATYDMDPHKIYIFNAGQNNIQMFDSNLQQPSSYTCSRNILQLASISPNRFVAVGYDSQNVYLLDERFSILQTILTPTDDYSPNRLCSMAANAVIVSESHNAKVLTRITEISLNGDKVTTKKLCKEDIRTYTDMIAYQDPGFIIYEAGSSIVKVNLRTGKSTSLCTILHLIWSLAVDGNTVLFGDSDGNVYKVEDGQKPVKILEGLDEVISLLPTDTGLVVTTNKKIQLYQKL